MKKIIKYTSIAVLGLGLLASCTEKFEEMNTSNIQVDPSDMPLESQCVEPMNYCYPPQQNMFQFWTNLTVDLYSGYFMTPNGNFTNGDMGENRGHSGGMYENYYLHIFNNTRRVIAAYEERGQKGLAGIMKIVQAYGTIMTTDVYGPLAYSSIISGEYESYFPFDSQKQIYFQVIDDLRTAATDIAAMSDAEKTILKDNFDDSWCAGDPEMWIKIANTMKLRVALRLSKREAEMKEGVTVAGKEYPGVDLKALAQEAAGNTLANNGKDIMINKSLENEMWLMFNWGDCGFNANLVTLMSGMKDPRQPLYMTKNNGDITNDAGVVTMPKETDYVGIRFASGLPGKPNAWGNFSYWLDPSNSKGIYAAPLPIFKQAESYFLLAEAKLRWDIGSESVQSLYEKGIRCSMDNELAYKGKYADPVITAYPAGAVDAYINNDTDTQLDFVDPVDPELNTKAVNKLCVKWDDNASNEDKLARIITQKYFALFPLSTEAWAEYRRTGYPVQFPPHVNESNGAVSDEEGVRRQIYSSNAIDTNAQGYQEGVELLNQENSSKTGHSGDTGGTRVWWDNANKGNF